MIMKKEINKKVFVLTLVLLSLIAINFVHVNAQETDSAPPVNVIKIAGTFTDLFNGASWLTSTSANVAKIFFFLMIAIVVYLVIGNIFGKSNQILMFVLSLIISFLATAYITPDEVYSILNSYSALGLTITSMIPLAVLMGLTYRAATAKEGQAQLIMLQWFAWILFGLYSIYRFVYDWFWAKEGSGFVNGIILITTIIAVLVAVFNKQLIRMLVHQYVTSTKAAAEETMDLATDFLGESARAQRRLGGEK